MGLRLVLSNWSCIDFYSQTELDLESHSCIVSKQKYSFSSAQGVIDVMQRTSCILLTTIFQMQFCFTIVFPQIERGFMSCAVKPRYPPTGVRSAKQGHDEIWNSAPFVCGKTWLWLKKWSGGGYSMRSPHKQKTTWQRPITSAFAWCCSRCPCVAYLVTARTGRCKRTGFACRWPLARVYCTIDFV